MLYAVLSVYLVLCNIDRPYFFWLCEQLKLQPLIDATRKKYLKMSGSTTGGGGGGGGRGGHTPPQTTWGVSGLHAWRMTSERVPCYAHAIYMATATEQHTVGRSKAGYKDFFVTQGREKSTDSVEGAAAQESIDSVK